MPCADSDRLVVWLAQMGELYTTYLGEVLRGLQKLHPPESGGNDSKSCIQAHVSVPHLEIAVRH